MQNKLTSYAEYRLYKNYTNNTKNTNNTVLDENKEIINKETKIYLIACRKNKYFLYKTDKSKSETIEHLSSLSDTRGEEWIKKYKPIVVVKVFQDFPCFDVFGQDPKKNSNETSIDKITKKYMVKYGIDNVRGGCYNQIELPHCITKDVSERENNKEHEKIEKKCERCCRTHTLGKCKAQVDIKGNFIGRPWCLF